MTSLKEFSVDVTEQEYHSMPEWNHSKIARYAREGFPSIATLGALTKVSPAMEFGSFFDTMITRSEDLIKEYLVSDIVPPDSEKKVLDALLAKDVKVPFEGLSNEIIKEAISECNYRSNYGFKAQYERISAFSEYYDLRRTGRKVVSRKDCEDALAMKANFFNNDYVKSIFGQTGDNKDIEYLYQLKFTAEMTLPSGRKVDVRIMPDLLIVNHKDRTIQPVDLKTSENPAYQFTDNFLRFRYDIEASMYSDVLLEVTGKIPGYSNYRILNYLFVDISRSDKIPVVYSYDQSKPLSFKQYTYKGWAELLDEILDYMEMDAKTPSYIDTTKANDINQILENVTIK